LLDWSYKETQLNGLLVGLEPSTGKRTAKIHIVGATEAEAEARFNALADHIAADLARSQLGRLYIGEWYLPCVFKASEKQYYKDRTVITQSYSLHSDDPRWVREKTWGFTSAEKDGDGLDMGFDYPHDYGAPWYSGRIVNSCPYPCQARITVEGPAEKWSIRIGSNVYQCDKTLLENEFLTMDGLDETITFVSALGNCEDASSSRMGVYADGSGSFVFEPVPAGSSPVYWDNCKAVEVTVYEKKDERPMGEAVT